jgi:hypothetical protein
LRCTDCGILDRVDERAVAHGRADAHALDCDHSVGVTPIQQFGIETPELGDIATVTYNSWRSGNDLEASGPVVGFELDDPDAPVFEVRIDIGDRIIVARYSPLDDVARDCLSVGTETQRLGTVIDVEYQPVMTDGGEELSEEDVQVVSQRVAEATRYLANVQSSLNIDHVNDIDRQFNLAIRELACAHDRLPSAPEPDDVPDGISRVTLKLADEEADAFKAIAEERNEPATDLLREFVQKTIDEADDVDRGRGIETDGGRARDGQRSLDDARWSPDQMRFDDLDGDEDEEIDRGDGIETDGGRDGRYGRDYETEWGTIRMSDRSHCVGLLDLDRSLTQEFQTVRMNTRYLRDLVDMAELLGWDEMLLSVAPDKPVMARPEAMSALALSAAPRISSGEADAEEEEEVNADE